MPEEPGIERATARAEAYRIIADPRFRTSSRNRDFLSYIVDALLEGRADRIKAYFIAVDVFGRPESFDPTLDPIVRIEATRLRVALEQFYQATGTPLGVRLDLPRGKYPVFMPAPVSSPVPPPSCEEAQLDPVPSDPAPPDPFRRRVRMGPRGKIACQRMAPSRPTPRRQGRPRGSQGYWWWA